MFIELCVDSMASALAAERGGADRIELCSHLSAGGLTPSYGLMKQIKDTIKRPVHVMIRPRAGDFLYSAQEFDVMKTDVSLVKSLGFEGIVFGMLTETGMPDITRMREIIGLAKPMKIVFHRAFDVCAEPFVALEQLIACGIDVILTSGQKDKAEDGMDCLAELVKQAGKKIEILVGSGITEKNILTISEKTAARHFHLSARRPIKSNMPLKNNDVAISGADETLQFVADENIVRQIIQLTKKTTD